MASDLIERLETQSEYKGVFISAEDAMIACDFNTLLIVVDVNRPGYVESAALLESINKIAVIDHHRRAADYIENAVVSLHEPYASSASELVSELLQYLVPTSGILTCEAEAMLAGIYLDTKGFSTRTGVRTFEAAAYLRRAGAESSDVKRLFQSSFDQYMERQKLISSARLRSGCYLCHHRRGGGPHCGRTGSGRAAVHYRHTCKRCCVPQRQ